MHAMSLIAFLALALGQQRMPPRLDDRDFKLAVKVTLDEETINFEGTQPMMVASRVLVPMRGVFEKMGATLQWDKPTSTVVAVRGPHRVVLVLGKNEAEIDGRQVSLDQPAVAVQGRTMVPLRFLAQSLGVKVDWLRADRRVSLTTGE